MILQLWNNDLILSTMTVESDIVAEETGLLMLDSKVADEFRILTTQGDMVFRWTTRVTQ